ncbi:hypothetical protein V1294_006888 [Bradyrhizobium sp. AZCC 1678]|uniref:hypothetical protein n=1 Tax=Bradyrhizobium sp. AZCC 1678 TaxID=3117030 RepID=UPI002FF18735
MKIVLFCDLLRAPDENKTVVGARFSGAAVRKSLGETDAELDAKLEDLFKDVAGRPLLKPGESGPLTFDQYLDALGKGAGPLFPWIGGELQFSFLWAAAKPGMIPDQTDPAGVTAAPILIPTISDASKHANFELTDSVFQGLLYTALSDLISKPPRSDKFTVLEPFKLAGWDDANGPQQIGEIDHDSNLPANFRYEAFMAGLASLPAPVPHGRLNLVRFAELSNVKPAPDEHIALVVAAPRFKPRGTGAWLEPKFDDHADPVVWNQYRPNIATIPYQSDFGGHRIEVVCRAVNLDEALTSSSSFLQRDTLWVARRHDGAAGDRRDGVGFDDWLASLPEMLADTFNLPQLVLQAMEDDAKAADFLLTKEIAKNDRKFGALLISDAVLLALRDVVGPGCVAHSTDQVVKGPNGSPAHAAIVEQVNWAVDEFRTGRPLDDTQKKALLAAVTKYDRDFRKGFATGAGDALQWFDVLAGVLGPLLELPVTGDAFVKAIAEAVAIDPTAIGPFDPAPLRRVVDAAASPATTAALQIAMWRKAAPDLEAWFSAASTAFDALLSRGLRLVEILRKANIDLPWGDEQGIWKKAANNSDRDIEVLKGKAGQKGNIREAIAAYLLGTLCEPQGMPAGLEIVYQNTHGRMGKLPAGARDIISDRVDSALKVRLEEWFREPQQDGGSGPLLKGDLAADAHPIALQIDRLVVGPGDAPDFNEDIAGFGVLMRRSQPPDDWRCLTAMFAEINPDNAYGAAAIEVTFETAPRTVMGALPVGYTSKMPQAIVVYDNRPIVGDSLADAPTEDQTGEDPQPRILRILQPVVQTTPPAETLLPFLAYGATYEVAPFGISNHGALPEPIRRDDYPAILDPAKLPNFAGRAFVRQFAYLRRTGIGSLHVASHFEPVQQQGRVFHPMVLPKATKPLAEEILVPTRAIEPWDKRSGLPDRALKMKTALLLSDEKGDPLVNKPEGINCGELKLQVSAPVTPLEDFDRWLALEEAITNEPDRTKLREFRKGVRIHHHAQVALLHDKEAELQVAAGDMAKAKALRDEIKTIKASLDLQDPAVGAFAIAATRVRRDGALTDSAVADFKPEFIEWSWKWEPDLDPKQPFAKKRKPIDLTCILDRSRAKPVFDKSDNSIWVATGDVVIVRLFAAVADELFTGGVAPAGKRRFDSVVLEKAALQDSTGAVLVTDSDGTKYRLFALHAFAVEAASVSLPADDELAVTISSSIVGEAPTAFDEHTGDIRLDFKRAPSIAMDAVGEITVGSQAWRWTGRPLMPFPFMQASDLNRFPPQDPDDPGVAEPPSPSQYALLWDVAGFAERLDETLDDESVAVPVNEKIEITKGVAASKPQPTRIALRSPARLDTARYMRFGVVASSRYAAAYAAARVVVTTRAAEWKSASGKWTTPWYRVLRPAKQPNAVPKPGIRALIPLTRALRESEAISPVAGVLAVADGAWFEHAGLADWMLAEVETAYRKKLITNSGVVARAAAEMGPDPLLRTYGLGKKPKTTPDSENLRTAVPLAVAGPLGHSFDTGTATGLYLNSSFIIRAPDLVADDVTAWWMGKLAFRRFVIAEGTTDYWSKSGKTPVKSTNDLPQVSATLHSIRASADNALLKLRAVGNLLFGNTPKTEVGVEASWSEKSWSIKVAAGSITDQFSIGESSFDLRILAARRLSRIAPDKPEQYAWYEIMVLVKPNDLPWRTAWQTQWFNDPDLFAGQDSSAAELEIDFVIDSQTGTVVGSRKVSTVLQVSEATEGRWAQFMPNAEVLGRTSKLPLTSLDLSVDPNTNTQLRLASAGNALVWLATNELMGTGARIAGKENQGLLNLLLLTKSVASVSGTDEEAYVGLYHSPAGYETGPKAVRLVSFGTASPPNLANEKSLIGRILTVRVGNPDIKASQIDKWKQDPLAGFLSGRGGR